MYQNQWVMNILKKLANWSSKNEMNQSVIFVIRIKTNNKTFILTSSVILQAFITGEEGFLSE